MSNLTNCRSKANPAVSLFKSNELPSCLNSADKFLIKGRVLRLLLSYIALAKDKLLKTEDKSTSLEVSSQRMYTKLMK